MDLVSLATEQRQDVKNAQAYIEEISAVLGNDERTLYSFIKDQRRLSNANEDMLFTLLVSLENEAQILLESTKSQADLREIQRDIALLRDSFEDDQHKMTTTVFDTELEIDPLVEKIKNVQQDARNTSAMTNQVLDELEDFLAYNNGAIESLSADERFHPDTVNDIEQNVEQSKSNSSNNQ